MWISALSFLLTGEAVAGGFDVRHILPGAPRIIGVE
jgi:hypothetical protein